MSTPAKHCRKFCRAHGNTFFVDDGLQDASAARDGSGTGTLALEAELSDLREALRAARFANRERDMEVAEMTIKLRDLKTQYSQCSSLLETQQRDNEQLVQKIEELQGRLRTSARQQCHD